MTQNNQRQSALGVLIRRSGRPRPAEAGTPNKSVSIRGLKPLRRLRVLAANDFVSFCVFRGSSTRFFKIIQCSAFEVGCSMFSTTFTPSIPSSWQMTTFSFALHGPFTML
jgi:hypothetical protein